PDGDLQGYGVLANRLPVATGERLLVNHDPEGVLALRPHAFTFDVVACGGLTRAAQLTAAARAADIPVFPHGRSFVPAVHLAAAFPHAVSAVEYRLQWEP